MRYLFAIVLPPLAVLLCRRPLLALLNVLLTICFWVPGMIHAMLVVNARLADSRNQELIRAIHGRLR